MQIIALKEVLGIEQVKVYSPNVEELATYKKDIEASTGLEVMLCKSADEAVENVDIAISTTPAKDFWVDVDAIAKGTHMIAVGADMPGKNEWDPEIFRDAKVVTDNTMQCISRGETRNAILAGVIDDMDIHAEIGQIIRGVKAGREDDGEITIFDTTGMAIQDNVTAVRIYELAKTKGIGTAFDFKSR